MKKTSRFSRMATLLGSLSFCVISRAAARPISEIPSAPFDCPYGLWMRTYSSPNATVTNLLHIVTAENETSTLVLQNVYTAPADRVDDDACIVTIGPYLLDVAPENTTMDISSSDAHCTESLKERCKRRAAVCRSDSAFDTTDKYRCRGNSTLEMHDGSAGEVLVFQRRPDAQFTAPARFAVK